MMNAFALTQRTLTVTTLVNLNQTVDMSSLALDVRTISLESATADAKGLRISQMFNTFTGKVDDVLTSVFDKLPRRDIVFKEKRTVTRKVLAADYKELSQLTAYVPPGMNSSYSLYITDVVDAELGWVNTYLLGKFIPALENYLAKVAVDVTILRSKRALAALPELDINAIEIEEKLIGEFFEKGSAATEVKLGTVIGNGKDWASVASDAEKYNAAVYKIDRKSMVKSADNIHEYSKIVSKRLNELEEVDQLTRNNVAKLAELVFVAARVFEFIAVWQAECNEFFTAVSDTQDVLEEYL